MPPTQILIENPGGVPFGLHICSYKYMRSFISTVIIHPFILSQGHTTGDKDIHVNLRMEITRNFDPRRRLRGAAIAVQTVNFFSKKANSKSKNGSFQRDYQNLDTKKVVFSDEVLNLSSETSANRDLHHGSDSRLNFSENMWQNIENLTSGDLPLRHVSSPEINSPTEERRVGVSELVLNALSEESVLPHQHGFSRSDNKRRPILRTRHDPSLRGNSSPDSCGDRYFSEDGRSRKRKRSHGARVESKDGTPIDRFHMPEMTENEFINLGQFIERDIILRPALIGEGAVFGEQTVDCVSQSTPDVFQEKTISLNNITQELKRLKLSLSEGANVAVEV